MELVFNEGKTMDLNFKKQIINDYSLTYDKFNSKKNIFTVNKKDESFLFYDKADFALICTCGKIFMRSDEPDLINELKENFKDYPGAWFAEAANIRNLDKILGEFGIEIDNFFPLMSFSDRKVLTKDFDFIRIEKEDISKFKGKTKMAFAFDDDDRIGLGFYDGKDLVALAGASVSGKYLWDIGLEKFSENVKYKGLVTSILRSLSLIIKKENENISPITETQFSHTKSINTAIRAGFEMNLCITGRKK